MATMGTGIIIVSLAPWARRSPWWEQARAHIQAGLAPASAALLMRYFAVPTTTTGALAAGEAVIIRSWAQGLPHWRDRADGGHFPLRFLAYEATMAAAPLTAR